MTIKENKDGFFARLSQFRLSPLTQSVGNGMDNAPDDVRKTKYGLAHMGLFNQDDENDGDTPDNPIITQKMDTAIKSFQRDNGLKIDGKMKPRGETERALSMRIAQAYPMAVKQKPKPEKDAAIKPKRKPINDKGENSIGFGGNVSDVIEAKKENSAPRGYDEDEYLNKVRKTYEGYVKFGKQHKLNDAAENLSDYLEGSKIEKRLTRKEARNKLFIRNGEHTNKKRFEESFVDKTSLGDTLSKLKNGESVNIQDHWDYKVGNFPVKEMIKNLDISRSHILRGDIDEALATGTSAIKSDGNFNAKRQGNQIIISGVVDHKWEDKYDFDPMQSGGAGAVTLEKSEQARKFDIKSNWQQNVTGVIQIKNGKLANPRIEWKDIDIKKEE
jgi:hypothetical protein